jgi:hypothetical protein
MRAAGQGAVVAVYLLMLVVGGLLILIAPLLTVVGAEDSAEMGGLAAVGVVFFLIGAVLTLGSILLLRDKREAREETADAGLIVEDWGTAPSAEGRDPWGGSEWSSDV